MELYIIMKAIALVILFGTISCYYVSFDKSLDKSWHDYKKAFHKVYTKEEELRKRFIWEERVSNIALHNIAADIGLASYKMGLNEFSDMILEEVIQKIMGYKKLDKVKRNTTWVPLLNPQLPEKVDWREEGLVTPIKNQKPCGACWAFSATGSLEGQNMRKTGKLISLSEQNLVDCSTDNDGCNGGDVNAAFEYVKNNKGIDTEEYYPYKATNGSCKFHKAGVGATCYGHVNIPEGDEEALKQAVAKIGPVSVIIDACHNSFINYKSGIFGEPKCHTDIPSHAVLVIGYGSKDGTDYWLVKNSWGTSWGMDGYIMMSRNKNNQCGIASRASYPLV